METLSVTRMHPLLERLNFDEVSRIEAIDVSNFKGEGKRSSTSILLDDDNLLEEEAESKEHLLRSEEEESGSGTNFMKCHPPSGIPADYESTMWFHSPIYKAIRSLFILSKRRLVQQGRVRGFLGLYLERYRHLSSFPLIIYPLSDFCWCWTVILIGVLMSSLMYEPFRISFCSEEYRSLDVSVSGVTSLILLFDILLTFITGYEGKSSNFVILEPAVIVRKYIFSWFFFDVCSRLPLDVILFYYYEFSGTETNLTRLRILGMIKIVRVVTLNSLLNKFLKCFQLKELTMRMGKLFLLFVLVIHWFACFHWLLPHLVNSQYEQPKNDSWVTQYSLWNETKSFQYLSCLLRSVSTVFLVSYGDISPVAPEEMFCTIISSIVGLTLYGFSIVLFTVYDSSSHRAEQVYNKMMVSLEEYFRFRKVPYNIRERIYAYYDIKFCGHYFPETLLLDTLSDNLRTEIKVFNCRHLVDKVPMFKDIPGNIIKDIIKRLVYEVYVPGDLVVTYGREGNCMYFVQVGTLQVLTSTGKIVGEIQDGNFFGEISLVTDEKRMSTVVARSRCETYRLSRDDFRNCVQGYSEVYERILQVARVRVGIEHHAAAINRNIHGEQSPTHSLAQFLQLQQNDEQTDKKLYGNENSKVNRADRTEEEFQEKISPPAPAPARSRAKVNGKVDPAKSNEMKDSSGNKNKQQNENDDHDVSRKRQ